MRVDLDDIPETVIESFHGGKGSVRARMQFDGINRVLIATLPPGSSIGTHVHSDNQETMYFLEGMGKVICDGVAEDIRPSNVHVCPRGSNHSLENTGDVDLVVFCSVVQL